MIFQTYFSEDFSAPPKKPYSNPDDSYTHNKPPYFDPLSELKLTLDLTCIINTISKEFWKNYVCCSRKSQCLTTLFFFKKRPKPKQKMEYFYHICVFIDPVLTFWAWQNAKTFRRYCEWWINSNPTSSYSPTKRFPPLVILPLFPCQMFTQAIFLSCTGKALHS